MSSTDTSVTGTSHTGTSQTGTSQAGAEREELERAEQAEEPHAPARRSPWFVGRRVVREFLDDDGLDAAAGLTFFSLLSLIPGLVALLAIVGLVGQASATMRVIEQILDRVVEPTTAQQVSEVLAQVGTLDTARVTFLIGLLGLLWTASAYVSALGRVMNRVYEVEEGRPFWRLRPMQVLVTVASLLLTATGILIVAVTGPVAEVVGQSLGLGDDLVTAWSYAKWPVLGLLVMALVALLYHLTPNVRFPRFRVITVGSFVAIMIWVAASAGFGFYVSTLGRYNSTYGTLAGAVVLALWLMITNLALVVGAELDAELERGRQLQRGLPAEERLVLPTRTDKAAVKRHAKQARDVARMRELRESAGGGNPDDRPFG